MGYARQRGAALIVTVVMLAIALILGLSSYQSSRLEESMAGNYRASSSALMAAEYAAAYVWNEEFLGTIKDESNDGETLSPVVVPLPEDDAFSHLAAYYYYKLAAPGRYDVVAIGEVTQDPPVYRYVQFQSRLAIGPGSALLASSDGEDCPNDTKIITASSGAFGIEGEEEVFGTMQAALQVGCKDAMNNVVDSLTQGQQTVDSISEEISEDPPLRVCKDGTRFCNYVGGVQGAIDIDIFKNPDLMARFIDSLRRKSDINIVHSLGDANGMSGQVTFVSGQKNVGSEAEPEYRWVDGSGNYIIAQSPDPDLDGATQVVNSLNAINLSRNIGGQSYNPNRSNDLIGCEPKDSFCSKQGGTQPRVDFSYGGSFSGDGVLIVDGNAQFQGVPGFEGLIIVLGDYVVVGSGGGDFKGSVVSAPISGKGFDPDSFASGVHGADDFSFSPEEIDFNLYNSSGDRFGNALSCWRDESCGFDRKIIQFTGGGNATYSYDLTALEASLSLLNNAVGEITTADGSRKSPRDLFAYGAGGDPLGYYAVNYRQSFSRPAILDGVVFPNDP